MTKFVTVAVFLCISVSASMLSDRAQADGLLIWTPVKLAPRTYQTTVGFRLPTAWETSAGANIGFGAGPGGRLLSGSELATLWGKVSDDRKSFAGDDQRSVALQVDTLRGSGAMLFNRSQSWIVSENLDMQASRSLSLNYGLTDREAASINATQALTLTYPWAGTSVSASGSVTDLKGAFTSTFVFDQPVAPNLNFTASFSDPLSPAPAGDVRLNYQIKW